MGVVNFDDGYGLGLGEFQRSLLNDDRAYKLQQQAAAEQAQRAAEASRREAWQLQNDQEMAGIQAQTGRQANSQWGDVLGHAKSMDILDRQNAMTQYDKLFGYATGTGASAGGGMGTSSVAGMGYNGIEKRLADLLDNPDSIKQTGAYKFRLNQGQEALQRSMGAKGMLNSGNRLSELTRYGQDMASQEYDNQYGRLSDLFGRYSGSRDAMFGNLTSALSGGLGSGGTGNIWNAYNTHTAGANNGYATRMGQGGAAMSANASMFGSLQDAQARSEAARATAQAAQYKAEADKIASANEANAKIYAARYGK
ncbi:MAG: hypothetical protein IPH08_04485 [Rhodocyclaceae bacterium]|nr:hypothetical protein [Rhodocyclaceae bacterium]